jgi:hypothetical protein
MKFLSLILTLLQGHLLIASLPDYKAQIQKIMLDTQAAFQERVSSWNKQFDDWQDILPNLEKSDQSTFAEQIDQLKNMISVAHDSLASALQKQVSRIESQQTIQVYDVASFKVFANNTLTNTAANIVSTIASLKTSIDKQWTAVQTQQAITKSQAALQAKQEYEKRIEALLQARDKIEPQIIAAKNAGDHFIQDYLGTNKFNQALMNDALGKYKTAIASAANAYKSLNLPIDFADTSNTVSMLFRQLLNLFLQDIGISIQLAQKALSSKPPNTADYYQRLYELVSRMGADANTGYDKLVADIVNAYFSSSAQAVLSYYHSQDRTMTIQALSNAIKKSAVENSKPNDTDLQYARAFYNALIEDLMLDPSKQSMIADMNQYMIIIYQNYVFKTLFSSIATAANKAQIRTQALARLNDAISFAKLTQNAEVVQQATLLASSLDTAIKALAEAQSLLQAKNQEQALEQYKIASTNFAVVSDFSDANTTLFIYNQLKGDQLVLAGKKLLIDLVTANLNRLQEYFVTISIAQQPIQVSLQAFDDVFAQLADASKKALDLYTSAVSFYIDSKIPTDFLNQSIIVLQNYMLANEARLRADATARAASNENLAAAQAAYQQMISYCKLADEAFKKAAPSTIPFYPSLLQNSQVNLLSAGQSWSFALMSIRHEARNYIEIASATENTFLAYQYLSQAYANKASLFDVMVQYISTQMKSIQVAASQINQILVTTATKQAAALQLSPQFWAADKGVVYTSNATRLWNEIIIPLRSATTLKYANAANRYASALIAYANAYKANVPATYFPMLGAALINYELLLFYTNQNDVTNAAASLVAVENNLKEFFSAGQELLQKVSDESLIASAIANQTKLVAWQANMEHAITVAENLVATLLPSGVTPPLKLQKNVDANGNTNYAIELSDGSNLASIIIPNVNISFANVYKRVAQASVAKKDYNAALQQYKQAQSFFSLANDATQAAQMQAEVQNVSSYAAIANWAKLVLPNDTVPRTIPQKTFAGIQVPERAEIYYFSIPIPDVIAAQFPLDLPTWVANPTQYKEQLKSVLTGFAFPIFAYYLAQDRAVNYANIFDGITPKQTTDPTIQLLLLEAKRLRDIVAAQYEKNENTVILTSQKVDGKPAYYYGIYYFPLPIAPLSAFSQTAPPFNLPFNKGYPGFGFPAVFIFDKGFGLYDLIKVLADSPKNKPAWAQEALKWYTPINDATVLRQFSQASAAAYVTAASLFKKRADYIVDLTAPASPQQLQDGTATVFAIDPLISFKDATFLNDAKKKIQELKKIDKKNFTVQLADYLWVFDLLKTHLTDFPSSGIVSTYISLARILYNQLTDTAKAQLLDQYLGSLFEAMGDAAQLFLVGDPQSPNYFFYGTTGGNQTPPIGGVLGELKTYYTAAIGLYNNDAKASPVYQKIGTAFSAAGDLVTLTNLSPDALVQAKIIDAKKNYFGALTFYLIAFSAFQKGVQIDQKIKDGAVLAWINAVLNGCLQNLMAQIKVRRAPISIGGTTISYADLVLSTLAPTGIDSLAAAVATNLKKDFIDVLYFLTYLNVAIPNVAKIDQTDKGKAAAVTAVDNYLKQNNIDLSGPESVTKWMLSEQFAKTFFGPITGFGNGLDEKAFGIIKEWINRLYFALGLVYGADYYPNYSLVDREKLIPNDLKTEEAGIYAPAQQWLGSFGG